MRLTQSGVFIVLLAGSLTACREQPATHQNEEPTPVSLTRKQCAAIRIAERFVLENGYTDAPATEDRSRIRWELADDPSRLDRVLQIRHDTLKPHAYRLFVGVPEDPLVWVVVFEYSDRLIALTARVEGKRREDPGGPVVHVKLDADPPWAVMVHADVRLNGVGKLPPPERVSALCSDVENAP